MCNIILSKKTTLLVKKVIFSFGFLKIDVNLRRISEIKKFFEGILILFINY